MSEVLGALYHWSPAERRDSIRANGLQPYSAGDMGYSWPYICLGFTPSAAWAYSGDMDWREEEDWDLWQVRLVEGDEIHIRAEFSPVLKEIRVHGVIPADRIWLIGTRGQEMGREEGTDRDEITLTPDQVSILASWLPKVEAGAGLTIESFKRPLAETGKVEVRIGGEDARTWRIGPRGGSW